MADDPLLGTHVGNYRLSYVLGEGGMGRVYAAVHPKIAGRVAIKVLQSHAPDLVARFFAEAKAVNLIKHPAIVKVYDLAHLPDGRPYMAMELVEGETLRRMLRRLSLPIGGVANALVQALGALAAAHDIGIVHRDFKPDNIMITFDGATKVLDFGIAKLSPWLDGGGPRTVTGARVGTPAYMAPEQIRGTGVDHRVDVYAAGIVLFEAITSTRPFAGDNEFELMKGHLEDAPPSPRGIRPELTPELEQVILQALAKEPNHRFQSAAAMANALAHVTRMLPSDQQRPLVPQRSSTIELHGGGSQPAGSAQSAEAFAPTAAPARADAPTVSSGSARRDSSRTTTTRTPRWMFAAAAFAVAAAITFVVIAATRGGSAAQGTPARAATPAPPVARGPVPVAPDVAAAPAQEGVIETLPSGAKQLTRKVALDAKTFDLLAYIPTAQKMARELVDDVELFSVTSDAVGVDGRVELSTRTSNLYLFVSPSRRKPADGMPRGTARLCFVGVSLRSDQVRAEAVPSTACDLAPTRAPTCTLAQIWEKAKAKGATPDARALISWTRNVWVFGLNAVGHKAVNTSFKDSCK